MLLQPHEPGYKHVSVPDRRVLENKEGGQYESSY